MEIKFANVNNLNYAVHEIHKFFIGVVFMPHPVDLSCAFPYDTKSVSFIRKCSDLIYQLWEMFYEDYNDAVDNMFDNVILKRTAQTFLPE